MKENATTLRWSLATVVLALAGAAVLQASAGTLPAPPVGQPETLTDWWTRHGTLAASMSLVRVAGLACCLYLALVGLLGALAAITRWRWTVTLARWATVPMLRRALAGGSVAVALASTSTASAALPAVYSVSDIGAATSSAGEQPAFFVSDIGSATPARDLNRITDLGPAASRSTSTTQTGTTAPSVQNGAEPDTPKPSLPNGHQAHPRDPSPLVRAEAPEGDAPPHIDVHRLAVEPATRIEGLEAGQGAATWIVEPGDNLWGIAARTVNERTGQDDNLTVLRYWLRVVEANADIVGDNPDLIFPGQSIRLPA